jgi:nitroreductase
MIAMDAGHLMQNLYLGCESLGLGTCAIGAYSGKRMDNAVNVDGKDEFVIYMAPVGHLKRKV